MDRIKKILVPVDFSADSDQAFRFAVDLARRYEASLDILHVFQTLTYALPEGYLLPSTEELARIMTEFQAKLAATRRIALEAGAPAVETTLLQGSSAEEILRFAKERASDMIVMGTHGRTGIKHFLIGSVAERVVRAAPCPVLTIRGKA